jgi:hypothetical protein
MSALYNIMAHFKYKDGQVNEYNDEEQVKELRNHPDFEEVVVAVKEKPVKKKE